MGPVRQEPIQRTVSLFICVCIALCRIVAHSIAQNRPDNFPSYPPDNHHCYDDIYLREGWVDSGGFKEHVDRVHIGDPLANTPEPFTCGGDVVLQSNCFDHLFLQCAVWSCGRPCTCLLHDVAAAPETVTLAESAVSKTTSSSFVQL